MILSSAKSGVNVKLVAISADRSSISKLSFMGLIQGAEFTIIRNDQEGPVIVAIKNSRFVLGRGLACKIEVELLP